MSTPPRPEQPNRLPLPAHSPARSDSVLPKARERVWRRVAVSCRAAADLPFQASGSDLGAARDAASVVSQESRPAAVEDHFWGRAADIGRGTAQKAAAAGA